VRSVVARSAQPLKVVADVVAALAPKNFVVKLNTRPLLAPFTRLVLHFHVQTLHQRRVLDPPGRFRVRVPGHSTDTF